MWLLIFSMFAKASMVGVWELPNGSQVLIPFHHPFKVPVLLLSPSGTHQIKEGVWIKESKELHLKTEGKRTLSYCLDEDVLSLNVDGKSLEMNRISTVNERHTTSGIWKDIHNEDIIPIFTDNKQWVVRTYSQSPPRLYEAIWSDAGGGTLEFSSTPSCAIHFEAGMASKGQLVCGDTTTFLERSFEPGPSNIEAPSGRWKNEKRTIEINVSNGQFVKTTLSTTQPSADELTLPQTNAPQEVELSTSKDSPLITELMSGIWVEERHIFSLVGQKHAWTCTFHPLSPNQLRCSDGTAESYWTRIE
ncbi:MAG: hypothetical protein VXZ96_02140 [Myxococcota bacterium]|nr:hypothetical protein [Myxococcota bacterium]MEC8379091.1 hypothetical protein [Myxococcota bacterium]